MKIITSIILAFSIISFKSIDEKDKDEIISLFLESYLTEKEHLLKKDTVFVLKENTFSLQKTFIPSIKRKEKQYEELSKICDLIPAKRNDSLIREKIVTPCVMRDNYQRFYHIFSNKELQFLKKYEAGNYKMNYNTNKYNARIIFLDSVDYYKKQILNIYSNNSKLQIKGPFLNKNSDKALLEIYEDPSCLSGLYVIFIKEQEKWKMIGNVNF